jgi:hypothetical protein
MFSIVVSSKLVTVVRISKGVTVEVLSWNAKRKNKQFVASYPKNAKGTTPGNATAKTQVYRVIRNRVASLNIKSFATLVSDQVTAMQASAAGLVDLAIGSILRSITESNAGVAMWIQQLIVNLLVTTRAATCSGEGLDTWMADFSFSRLSAVQSTGPVTFSRFTATNQALIAVGSSVTTTDGTQAFTVTTDTTNAAYDPVQGGYIIAAGVSSLSVPVQANTAGAAGNAQAGTITVISGSIQYVDTVTNSTTFTNGKDAESDTDFRARFVLWIASLSKATKAAIGYAISSMQSGVTYTLTENTAYIRAGTIAVS